MLFRWKIRNLYRPTPPLGSSGWSVSRGNMGQHTKRDENRYLELLTHYCAGDKIEKNEMGWACGAYR
jgi:hypothetical protein